MSFYAELHYNSVYPNSEVDTQMRGPQRDVRRNEARAHAEREFKKDEENFVMHHLYEHTPDFGQLLDMLRLTAEANKISPEEMHRIIGQRLNVNNVEQEYERECRSCGVDISNRPLNITQCLDCWRSGRGIPRASLQGLSTFARRVNDSSTLNRDENEISKRIRSLEQNLKEIKEELELLK